MILAIHIDVKIVMMGVQNWLIDRVGGYPSNRFF
jgi:hypothetical protein